MIRDDLLKRICPWGTCDCGDDYESCNCDDCNRVLEEWLYDYDKHVIEQYKADTNLKDTIRNIHDNVAQEMYCKGIDDFVNALDEVKVCEVYDCVSFYEIEHIAEQLKAGVENERY